MRAIKTLITGAIAAALLMLPAAALAKDRDHDRMPDKWEKRHHLNVHANDARKDPDHDGLRNLSEFRHDTDPQDADTDDDGIDDENEVKDHTSPLKEDSDDDGVDDEDEVSGTIVSFVNNVLTIQLPAQGAGTVQGTVNANTEIECDDNDDSANASDNGSDDDQGEQEGENENENEDENEDNCTVADLKAGARVHEAEFVVVGGVKVFTEIELVAG